MDLLISSKYPSYMKYKGFRGGSLSWNGFSLDVLKSAVQKYVRRGLFEKALYCVTEIDLFHELYQRDGEKGVKAISTNLVNRLLIISVEDIGIGNPSLPLAIDPLVKEYMSTRFGNSNRRREILYSLTHLLCNSKRSRELSHLRTVYSQVFSFDGKTFVDSEGKKGTFCVEHIIEKYPSIYSFERSGDEISAFQSEYSKGSDACFYWFFLLFNKEDTPSKIRSSVYPLLKYVIHTEKDQDRKKVMEILLEWFKAYEFKEFVLFALQLILIGLRGPKIATIPDVDVSSYQSLYIRNVEGYKMEIDDFCIDKHTREGRAQGKDLRTFAVEGSFVTDEHHITNQDYKEIYTSFRTILFSKVSKSPKTVTSHHCSATYKTGTRKGTQCTNTGRISILSPEGEVWYCGVHAPRVTNNTITESAKLMIDIKHYIPEDEIHTLHSVDTARGQLLTGKNKKSVLIPMQGPYNGYILKGPWKVTDISRINVMLFRSRIMKLLNVKHVSFLVLGSPTDDMYLVMKNLATTDSSQWKMEKVYDKHVPKRDKSGTVSYGMEVLVVDRESMGVTQLSKLSQSAQKDILFGAQFLIKGLILLALLRVGDVGYYNILVREGIAYIIDYEENTSRASFSELGHLLARQGEKSVSLIREGIREHKKRVNASMKEIESHIPLIKEQALAYGYVSDIEKEWTSIRSVIEAIE